MFHVVYRQHQSFLVVNSLCWHREKKEHACTESSVKKLIKRTQVVVIRHRTWLVINLEPSLSTFLAPPSTSQVQAGYQKKVFRQEGDQALEQALQGGGHSTEPARVKETFGQHSDT